MYVYSVARRGIIIVRYYDDKNKIFQRILRSISNSKNAFRQLNNRGGKFLLPLHYNKAEEFSIASAYEFQLNVSTDFWNINIAITEFTENNRAFSLRLLYNWNFVLLQHAYASSLRLYFRCKTHSHIYNFLLVYSLQMKSI